MRCEKTTLKQGTLLHQHIWAVDNGQSRKRAAKSIDNWQKAVGKDLTMTGNSGFQ
jgi:hypothetical protein